MSHEKYQTGGVFDPRRPVRFEEEVVFQDRAAFNGSVSPDGSSPFFKLTGTLPTQPSTTFVDGIEFGIKSAGNGIADQASVYVYLDAGYTGIKATWAFTADNFASGTASGLSSPSEGNYGAAFTSSGSTTGSNVGVYGYAANATLSVGVVGQGTQAGIVGLSSHLGGYFGLNSGNPALEDAGVLADNGTTSNPIIKGRDNGTPVWSLEDGGSVQGKMGTKTLTEGAATAFVQVSVPSGTTVGGCVYYTIEANDGTDFQARSGVLPFAAVNKAGTETGAVATVSTATETVAVSVGTLTNTFDVDTSPTNAINIRANATSSLAQTTLRISYRIEMYCNAVVTVTPL